MQISRKNQESINISQQFSSHKKQKEKEKFQNLRISLDNYQVSRNVSRLIPLQTQPRTKHNKTEIKKETLDDEDGIFNKTSTSFNKATFAEIDIPKPNLL